MRIGYQLVSSPGFSGIEAQRRAVKNPLLHTALCRNKSLHEDVWYTLWPQKGTVECANAYGLVARELTREQALHVLEREKRSSVLATLVSHTTLDLDLQERIVGLKSFTPTLAEAWVHSKRVHPALLETVARRAGGSTLRSWLLANCEQLPLGTLEELLASWHDWAPASNRDDTLERLVARRPDLLPLMTRHRSWVVRRAAAGSRHLFSLEDQRYLTGIWESRDNPYGWSSHIPVMFRLIQNPNTSHEVLREIEVVARENRSLHQLHAMIWPRIATPAVTTAWEETSGSGLKKVFDHVLRDRFSYYFPALAANQNLDPEQSEQLMKLLQYCRDKDARRAAELYTEHHGPFELLDMTRPVAKAVEVPSDEEVLSWGMDFTRHFLKVERVFEILNQELGDDPDAWEVLLGVVDGFEGTLGELLTVVRCI